MKTYFALRNTFTLRSILDLNMLEHFIKGKLDRTKWNFSRDQTGIPNIKTFNSLCLPHISNCLLHGTSMFANLQILLNNLTRCSNQCLTTFSESSSYHILRTEAHVITCYRIIAKVVFSKFIRKPKCCRTWKRCQHRT